MSYRHQGFTLVELLLTIGVGAILLGLAVPSFTTVIQNSRITAGVNDLLASMTLARSEAIKRRLPITVCRASNATAAVPTCASGTGWEDGWVVFVDNDGDAVFDGAPELVVRASDGFNNNGVSVVVPGASAPLDDSLTFLASGFPANPGNVGTGRNMLVCDGRASDYSGRVLNLSQTGRPKVRRVADVANLGVSCEA